MLEIRQELRRRDDSVMRTPLKALRSSPSNTAPPLLTMESDEATPPAQPMKRRTTISVMTPPPTPKKRRRRKAVLIEAIPLNWDEESEALAASGLVRERFLSYSPNSILREDNRDFLCDLKERLVFRSSQPHNACEEAYVNLLVDCISERLLQM